MAQTIGHDGQCGTTATKRAGDAKMKQLANGCPSSAAKEYVERGWSPVPVRARSKRPVRKGWQHRQLTSAEIINAFNSDSNVGLLLGEPSGWLVDVDLDCDETAQMASDFLPATKCISGRGSRSRSHYWYRAVDSKTEKHHTPDGNMLVELRSTGGQTLVYPSVHPTGEEYAWDEEGEPADVDAADLSASVKDLAAAALLARHWPNLGSRHNTALALAGLFARHDVARGRAERIIVAAADFTGNGEEKRAAVQDTYRNYSDGHEVTGGKTAEEYLGAPVVQRLCKILRLDDRRPKPVAHSHAGQAVTPTFPHTDLGNAERFVAQYGRDVRYCHPWGKWLVWDGRRWAIDQTAAVEHMAKQTVRAIYKEASAESDGDIRRALAKWAVGSEKAERINAMLKLARSERSLPVMPANLDTDPWLLNVKNGTLDLRSGKLRGHQRGDLITKLAPVEYLPAREAECPLWDQFLHDTFAGNDQLIQFVQRLCGYALTGLAREHILPIFYGIGSNGKSTFLETIMGLLGADYAMKAPPDLLLAKKTEAHPTERADLFGKRLVVAIETDDNRRLAESLVKELTGGDRIRARRMREDFWEFVPTHTIILATNHKPVVRGTDHAIWRRLVMVPFSVVIPNEKQDKALTEKLKAERPGILRWAVEGCVNWQQAGLGEPEAVSQATAEYRSEQDVVGAFLNECCIVRADCEASATELYEHYSEWCGKSGEFRQNQRRFGEAMTERGFDRVKKSGVWYRGVGLWDEREERDPNPI